MAVVNNSYATWVDLKVVDSAKGTEVGGNQIGELLLRSPGIMIGYLDNPDQTAATIDEEGWLHTGLRGLTFISTSLLHWI